MDITEARTAIYMIATGESRLDPEAALTNMIDAYRSIGAHIKEIEALQAKAKQYAVEIMQDTGQTKAITPAGTATFTAPSERVSYDTNALNALCASDGLVARLLAPHRKVTQVAGGLTIK